MFGWLVRGSVISESRVRESLRFAQFLENRRTHITSKILIEHAADGKSFFVVDVTLREEHNFFLNHIIICPINGRLCHIQHLVFLRGRNWSKFVGECMILIKKFHNLVSFTWSIV